MTISQDYLSSISFSKLRQLYECPRQWEQKYILKKAKENDVAEDFKRGEELHFLIENALRNGDYDELENIELVKVLERIRNEAFEVLIEEKIIEKVQIDDKEYEIVGIPDIVAIYENYIDIIDIKGQFLWHTMEFVELDKFTQIQLMFYAFLLRKQYPEKEIRVGVLSYTSPMPFVAWNVDEAAIEKFWKKLIREIRHAKQTIEKYFEFGFEARPGSWCSYCQYKLSCPSEYKIEDIHAVARELRKLEEKVSELRKALKEYTRETGQVIDTGDYEYGWFERVETEVDSENLLRFFIEKGIDFRKFYKPDLRKIMPLAKESDEVANFVFQNITYQFGGRKKKGGSNNE